MRIRVCSECGQFGGAHFMGCPEAPEDELPEDEHTGPDDEDIDDEPTETPEETVESK